MHVPMPLGEVVDRITILRLKVARLEPRSATLAQRHLAALEAVWSGSGQPTLEDLPETAELVQVNTRLWDVEDTLRGLEAAADFGPEFVRAARRVYALNDQRAQLKARIDASLGSPFTDPKSYGLQNGT